MRSNFLRNILPYMIRTHPVVSDSIEGVLTSGMNLTMTILDIYVFSNEIPEEVGEVLQYLQPNVYVRVIDYSANDVVLFA